MRKLLQINGVDDIQRVIRDKAIVGAYFAELKELRRTKGRASPYAAIREVIRMPAPRFFVDYERARKVVLRMERGQDVHVHGWRKQKMYADIRRLCADRQQETGCTIYEALRYVIEHEAPSYYISHLTARGVIYRALRNRRRHKKQ